MKTLLLIVMSLVSSSAFAAPWKMIRCQGAFFYEWTTERSDLSGISIARDHFAEPSPNGHKKIVYVGGNLGVPTMNRLPIPSATLGAFLAAPGEKYVLLFREYGEKGPETLQVGKRQNYVDACGHKASRQVTTGVFSVLDSEGYVITDPKTTTCTIKVSEAECQYHDYD